MEKDSSKGNESGSDLRIYCRLRPGSENKKPRVGQCSLQKLSNELLSLRKDNSFIEQHYIFEHIFGEDSKQDEIFDRVAAPLLESMVKGEDDSLIFAYGVTSSGKSHTIGGNPDDPGLIPRALSYLFTMIGKDRINPRNKVIVENNIFSISPMFRDSNQPVSIDFDGYLGSLPKNQRKYQQKVKEWSTKNTISFSKEIFELEKTIADENKRFSIFLSFVEIYNNYVYDLLEYSYPGTICENRTPLLLAYDRRNMHFVQGSREIEVTNLDEAYKVFLFGLMKRRTDSTQLNETSSRSHSIFNIKLISLETEDDYDLNINQFSVVDLAGIERTNRTQNTKEKLAEACNINNSLMALRSCFESIRKKGKRGLSISFRQSKLTMLLRRFFEYPSQIRMIICIRPDPDDYEENLQVLNFCQKAQQIVVQNLDNKNQLKESEEILELQLERFNTERVKDVHPVTVINEVSQFFHGQQKNYQEIFEKLETIAKYTRSKTIGYESISAAWNRMKRQAKFLSSTHKSKFQELCKKIEEMIREHKKMCESRKKSEIEPITISVDHRTISDIFTDIPMINNEFREKLKIWNMENKDLEEKLITLASNRCSVVSGGAAGGGPSCSKGNIPATTVPTTPISAAARFKNMDVFNRLYLQSPLRYQELAIKNRIMIHNKRLSGQTQMSDNGPLPGQGRVKYLAQKFNNSRANFQNSGTPFGGGKNQRIQQQQQQTPDARNFVTPVKRQKAQTATSGFIDSYAILQQRKIRRQNLFPKSSP